MKKLNLICVLAVSILLSVALNVGAIKNGTVITSVCQPDPIQQGGKIIFKTTVLNNGTESWLRSEYNYKVILLSKDNTYLEETFTEYGARTIPVSTMDILENTFTIPISWSGQYNYKAVITIGDKTIESQTYSFWVSEVVKRERKPIIQVTDGRFGIDFRGSNRYNSFSELNLGFDGTAGKNTYDLAIRGRYNNTAGTTQNLELHDVHLIYNLPGTRVSLGDVSPRFSEYTLYGRTSRGGLVDVEFSRFKGSLISSSSREKEEVSGIYAQNMYGGAVKYEVLSDLSASISYLKTCDDKSSLSASGYTSPVDNEVAGISIDSEIMDIGIEFEYAESNYDNDLLDAVTFRKDDAFSFKADYRYKDSSVGINFSRIDPNFYALGNTGIINNRVKYNVGFTQQVKDTVSFSIDTDMSQDNLAGDTNSPTTDTRSVSFNGFTLFSNFPRINLGLSGDSNKSDEVLGYKNDNTTLSGSLGVSHSIKKIYLSLNSSLVKFKDITQKTNDSDTLTNSLNVSLPLMSGLMFSSGLTSSLTDDLTSGEKRNYNTVSGNLSYSFGSISCGINFNSSLNNNSSNTVDNRLNGIGADASFGISGMLVRAGIESSSYEDSITASSNYTENVLKIGINYNF
jgi:hypothetical protein